MKENKLFFKCTRCGRVFETPIILCSKCKGLVEADYAKPKHLMFRNEMPGIWRYKHHLPPIPYDFIVTLSEGLTPLIEASNLSKELRLERVYIKDETRNPTGSFRDRVATIIVSHAYYVGAKHLVCATDGNLGAAIAAYAAKAKLKCTAVVPTNADYGKILQMIAYGASIIEHGNIIDEALLKAFELGATKDYYQATAGLNTLSIEGLKTISYEIYEKLRKLPDWIVLPVGTGLTLYSIIKGFKELGDTGIISKLPKVLIVQSLACSPIVNYIENLEESSVKTEKPIPGLDVCKPIIFDYIVDCLQDIKARGVRVHYAETLNYVCKIARLEGLFLEPAAAAAFVGLEKAVKEDIIFRDETVMVLAPATGLKATITYTKEPSRKKYVPKLSGLNTKTLILEILKEKGPLHGYAVWKELGLSLTVQAIYQHLTELERRGLVEGKHMGKRRVYGLTKKGLNVLASLSSLK